MITLLDACLVNGYGAKTAAGWTKAYADTNQAAYRMGAGLTQAYLQVNDTTGGKAIAVGYRTMAGIDTGTDRFPTGTINRYLHKSNNADATVRPWQLAADERTFIFRVNAGTINGNVWSIHYFGEIYSFLAGDLGAVALIMSNTATITSFTENMAFGPTTDLSTTTGSFILSDAAGMNAAAVLDLVPGIGSGTRQVAPNLTDGGILLAPVYVRGLESGSQFFRGMLRGVYFPPHYASQLLLSTTGELAIGGANLLADRSFSIRRTSPSSGTFGNDNVCFAVQTSGAVLTN